jgi:chemotaxis protein MotB
MMPRRKKPVEPGGSGGAPEWMVTFSDCMTLLLTFFVLLLTFSAFDEAIFQRLKKTFADFPSVSHEHKDAVSRRPQEVSRDDISEGSEKPTLDKGRQDGLKKETGSSDFRRRKVFLISSERVFWGKGTTISRQGREVLAAAAAFLKQVPGRIVISENGPKDGSNEHFGLPRAWAVTEHLASQEGVDRSRFSISAATTLVQNGFRGNELATQPRRMLEIVLLERSIYR